MYIFFLSLFGKKVRMAALTGGEGGEEEDSALKAQVQCV